MKVLTYLYCAILAALILLAPAKARDRQPSYADVYDAVKAGDSLTVTFGAAYGSYPADAHFSSFKGVPDGVYVAKIDPATGAPTFFPAGRPVVNAPVSPCGPQGCPLPPRRF